MFSQMSRTQASGLLFSLLAIVIVCEISAQQSVYQFVRKRPSNGMNKYCGKNLANALHLLCNGVYNSMFKKRNQEMIDPVYEDSFPFTSRVVAKTMVGRFRGSKFRRQVRGVHDECCAKPCTIDELSSYCAT